MAVPNGLRGPRRRNSRHFKCGRMVNLPVAPKPGVDLYIQGKIRLHASLNQTGSIFCLNSPVAWTFQSSRVHRPFQPPGRFVIITVSSSFLFFSHPSRDNWKPSGRSGLFILALAVFRPREGRAPVLETQPTSRAGRRLFPGQHRRERGLP